jgi:hypothetical protein
MAVSADLSKYLDKSYEDKTLAEVLAAPVSSLAGVTDGDADHLAAAFNIKTVPDLWAGTSRPRASHARPAT